MGEFRDYLEDLFAPLGGVTFRRMFGGLGIFRDGVMFALVADDVLHFKADETTRARFAAENAQPFAFTAKGRTVATSYWRVPERLLDEPEAFRDWALAAFAVAERAREAKPKGKRGRKG